MQAHRLPRATVLVDADATVRTGAAGSVGEWVARALLDSVVPAIVVRIIVVGAESARILRHARSGAVVAADQPLGTGRGSTGERIVHAIVVAAAPEEGREQEQRRHGVGPEHGKPKGKARATCQSTADSALGSRGPSEI